MPNFTIDQISNAMKNPDVIRNFSIVAQVDAGKCFKIGTQIRLSDGSLKTVENLTTNDSVIGLDGQSKRVVEIHHGNGQLYKVSQSNGDEYVVNGNHILVLKKSNDILEISVSDYLKLLPNEKLDLTGFKQDPNSNDKHQLSQIEVDEDVVGDYIGFQIEGDGKFLAPDFTVWHNSTLSDSILSHAGLINKDNAGDKRETDTMQQEIDRGITIKAVGVSMCVPHEGNDYVLGLVDSPGHVDFNSEVSCSIRVTDGALVLIDTVDGVKAQTKTVLTQALAERVKPVLVINKIDKLFMSLQMTPREIYQQFLKNVEDVNGVIDTYQDPKLVEMIRDQRVDPVRGDVMFGAAYQTWGFSLKTFAKIYSTKLNKPVDKLMQMLWNEKNFVTMIIQPIYFVLNACQSYPEPSKDGKTLEEVIKVIGIKLSKEDFELRGLKLIRKVMNTWIPLAPAVVELAVDHLPSPKVAQQYRAELLYKGPHDDKYFEAIKNCDPNGPMVIYISKMVPTKDNSRFYAFGRVFAGTARSGKVKILFNDHDPGNTDALATYKQKTYLNDTIQRVVLMMAANVEMIDSIPVGNTLGLSGVDKSIVKSATIVSENSLDCYPLKNIAFSVSPVVQYALRPKNMADLGKFVEQMKKFVKSDPCLQYITTQEGEHILAGAGELHLEVAIEQFRTDFLKGIEFDISEPIVPYCETIIDTSSTVCLAKSPNKHNRLFFTAQPLDSNLVSEILDDSLPKDPKELARHLIDTYGFDDAARKIWKFGPEVDPSNMLVDDTKGVQYLNEIRDSLTTGFLNGCLAGPLCEEPIRGVRFNLKDVVLHADAVHRGAGQLLPTARRVLYASMLTGQPRLMEPVFLVDVQIPRERVSSIYGVMTKRRGNVKIVEDEPNGNMMHVEADLPVAESFGFIEELRHVTSGTAFASLSFSHWQLVPGDPMEEGSYAHGIMMKIRKRKDLKIEKPKLDDFMDKL